MNLSALVWSLSNTVGSFPPTFMSIAWGIGCCGCCCAGPCGENPPPPPPPPPQRAVRAAVKRAWMLVGDTWFAAGAAACVVAVDVAACVVVVDIVGSWVSVDMCGLLVIDRTTGEFHMVLLIDAVLLEAVLVELLSDPRLWLCTCGSTAISCSQAESSG